MGVGSFQVGAGVNVGVSVGVGRCGGWFGRLNIGSCLIHVSQVHRDGDWEMAANLGRGEVGPSGHVPSINGSTPSGEDRGKHGSMIKGNSICQHPIGRNGQSSAVDRCRRRGRRRGGCGQVNHPMAQWPSSVPQEYGG
jgi:hypothetical protein